MRIFLGGAGGFIGRHVARHLSLEGHEVVALIHRESDRDPLLGIPGVHALVGDVRHPEEWRGALAGCEAVVHLMGILVERGDRTFRSVHVEGTRRIVDATRAAGIRRFVHMGSLAAHPDATAWARSRSEGEEIVRRSGLDWTILRPAPVFGPGDSFLTLLARLARLPVVPLPPGADAPLRPVSVVDVALAFTRALRRSGTVGHALDLGGPERTSLAQIARRMAGALGTRPAFARVPLPLARAGARALHRIAPGLLVDPALLETLRLYLGTDCDPEPARHLLDLPLLGIDDGIRAVVSGQGPLAGGPAPAPRETWWERRPRPLATTGAGLGALVAAGILRRRRAFSLGLAAVGAAALSRAARTFLRPAEGKAEPVSAMIDVPIPVREVFHRLGDPGLLDGTVSEGPLRLVESRPPHLLAWRSGAPGELGGSLHLEPIREGTRLHLALEQRRPPLDVAFRRLLALADRLAEQERLIHPPEAPDPRPGPGASAHPQKRNRPAPRPG